MPVWPATRLAPSRPTGRARRSQALFGRRIATVPGYDFSEALKRLDIVWTPETVSRLFEVGPAAYTPGTKMPEQRIGSEQDRAALVQFLERATNVGDEAVETADTPEISESSSSHKKIRRADFRHA